MRPVLGTLALCLLAPGALIVAAPAHAQPDPCATVDCSGHGMCFPEHGAAHCFCHPGHASLGHACVPVEEPDVLRLRRDPAVGERVAELAMSQVERTRWRVGEGMELGDLEPLGRYLEVDEWWCSDFVAWVYAAAGVPFTQGAAGGWLITNNVAMRAWYVRHGLWRSRYQLGDYVPQPGDFVRIRTDRGGHAAIVHHVEGDTLYAVEGNVSGRVEIGRYYHYRDNRLIDGVGPLVLPNAPPEVDAGEDLRAVAPAAITLSGTVVDDGPEARLTVGWDVVSGPGRVRLSAPDAATVEARFDRAGRYRLRLRARDGEHDVEDTIEVEVIENAAPTVSARVLEAPGVASRARVGGEARDDDRPGPLTTRWTMVEGPAPVVFSAPDARATEVELAAPGEYVIRFTASDGAREASADLTLSARPWYGGCAIGTATTPRFGAAPLLALPMLAWRVRRRVRG